MSKEKNFIEDEDIFKVVNEAIEKMDKYKKEFFKEYIDFLKSLD